MMIIVNLFNRYNSKGVFMKKLKLSVILASSLIMTSTMHAVLPLFGVATAGSFVTTWYDSVQRNKASRFEHDLECKAKGNDLVAQLKLAEYRKFYRSSDSIINPSQVACATGFGFLGLEMLNFLNSLSHYNAVRYTVSPLGTVIALSSMGITLHDVQAMKKAKKAADEITNATTIDTAQKFQRYLNENSNVVSLPEKITVGDSKK